MAAVICGSISNLCSGLCECVGAVCKAPFQLCGACCDGLMGCCSTSFCCYVTVALALNLPPIIVGIMDLPNVINCSGSVWLLVFWLLSVVNIVSAFYMSHAVQADDSILPTSTAENKFEPSGGAGRMKQLFCYDGYMAVYMLTVIGYVAWLCFGAVWFVTGKMNDDDGCDDNLHSKIILAMSFGWAFLMCGSCALCTSMCCTSLCNPPGSSRPHHQQPVPAITHNNGNAPAALTTNNKVDTTEKVSYSEYAANPAANEPTVVPAANVTADSNSKPTHSTIQVPVVEVQPVNDNDNPPKPSAPVAQATLY